MPRRGLAPPRNDRGDRPGKKQRSFRGRKPVGIRFPFPLLPHVEKVKSDEVLVKRCKALPVGEGGPTGRVRDRTVDMRRISFSRALIRLLRRHLPPRGRLMVPFLGLPHRGRCRRSGGRGLHHH